MDSALCPLCKRPLPADGSGSGAPTCEKCAVKVSTSAEPDDRPAAGRRTSPGLADLLRSCGYRNGGDLISVGAGDRPLGSKGKDWRVVAASEPVQAIEGQGVCDVVLLDNHLSKVSDPRAVLRACGRLLRPRGAVVAIESDYGSASARAQGPLWGPARRKRPLLFSRNGLEDLLRQEGFVVMDVALGIGSPIARFLPGALIRLPLPDRQGELALLTRFAR